MRERFSEIQITGSSNSTLPVGADAKNITLEDGSILEQALGDINFQENGSIIDQIDKLDKKIQENTDFAPLTSPRIKDSFAVRRYNKDNIFSNAAYQGGTIRGITAEYSVDEWKISGTIEAGDNAVINLYGFDDRSQVFAEASTYKVTIKENLNDAIQGLYPAYVTSLRFDLYDSTNQTTTSIYVYKDDQEQGKEFEIPQNSFLYRVCLNIHAGNEGVVIDNGILKFEVKNLQDQNEDKYNVVFAIHQNPDSKKWTTTVAENLVVDKGQQQEARSSLGTIYNSKWEGNLDVNGLVNVNWLNSTSNGVTIKDGALLFKIDDLNSYTGETSSQKATSQHNKWKLRKSNISPFYIAPWYTDTGAGALRYGAENVHHFAVGSKASDGEIKFSIGNATTHVRNTLWLEERVLSDTIIQYQQLNTFKDIENMMNDNTKFPLATPILFAMKGDQGLGTWFAWTNSQYNTNSHTVLGLGYKWRNGGELFFQGFAMATYEGGGNFINNAGLYKFSYSFKPSDTTPGKGRKIISYRIFTPNSPTIDSSTAGGNVHIRLCTEMNDTTGMWTNWRTGDSSNL